MHVGSEKHLDGVWQLVEGVGGGVMAEALLAELKADLRLLVLQRAPLQRHNLRLPREVRCCHLSPPSDGRQNLLLCTEVLA